MNDIEKAIEYLENINQDCESCKYNCDGHNTDGSECHVSHNVNLAEKALREKQERDNMRCGNCRNYIGEDDDGFCVREDLFELPTVKLSDYCSYFEKREV